jgi:hypothetical protein
LTYPIQLLKPYRVDPRCQIRKIKPNPLQAIASVMKTIGSHNLPNRIQ